MRYREEFGHLRGAYVDCTFDFRDLQNGELPSGHATLRKVNIEWREGKVDGILGFSKRGLPQFDGETCFEDVYRKFANVRMVERFRPKVNSVRHLCRGCAGERPFRCGLPIAFKPHPIGIALKAARRAMGTTSAKALRCSVCGGRDDYSIFCVPSDLWWITTDTSDEDVEKALAGMGFERVMKDATIRLFLTGCTNYRFETTTPYDLRWQGSHGEYCHGQSDEPPPSSWWGRWMDIEDLRPYVNRIRTNDGGLLYERPKENP